MKNYDQGFSLLGFVASFKHAFRGLKLLLHGGEYNLYIHITCAIAVTILGFAFQITSLEWIVQCLVIGLVIFAEITNILIEKILDFFHPNYHRKIKDIKDVAAGMVLFTAIISLIIGGIMYVPKIF